MKNLLLPLVFLLVLLSLLSACRKSSFIDGPEARLSLSADTLRFDTVFTRTGSITQQVKIFNRNDRKLRLSHIRLSGGNRSFFTLNIDGTPANDLRDLELDANDSLYVFVTVTIDPTAADLPFLVRDSVFIGWNGNETLLQLEAYGQNARFIRNGFINGAVTFDRQLPYVILGGLLVDSNASLTIEKGSRLYLHADAPLVVEGSLTVAGTAAEPVVFTGDRLDEGYRDLPASWPGLYFLSSSTNNVLRHARILNAYQGIVADQPAGNAQPKLTLEACVIDNAYEAAIIGIRTSIRATNCRLTNAGTNLLLIRGGDYHFTHCTVASYSSLFLPHKQPVLVLNNYDSSAQGVRSYPLTASFTNNIFWGDEGVVDNEVVIVKRGNDPFTVTLQNNLYRAKQDPAFAGLTDNIKNQDPQFDSINTARRYYDFRLQTRSSPAVNKGRQAGISTDLEGVARDNNPDIGCYEKH